MLMLTTSLTLHRKAKDGKDGTSVTILSTKVLYQVSASPTDIPTTWYDDIKNAIQTDSKPYLWSKTIVAYSDNNKTITFSVSYKGKDGTNGTSFTPKGTATGFFYNMSSVPSYEDGMDSDVYIVNVDDRSNPTSELPPYVCRYEYESLVVYHAEFGDSYNVNGHLYVANSDEWVDFGEIQGAKGEKGDDGMDAINIVFSPAELVFDADENGNLVQAEKSAEVKVFRGNKQLTYLTDWDFPNVDGKQPGDNCNATFMVEENSSPLKPIAKIYDISSTKIEGTKPQAFVPASSGGINVPIKINDVTYNAYLSFAVNVNTFAHTLIEDNKQYIQKYTEVSNKYTEVSKELNNKANQSDMRKVESTIAQMPDQIKLEVYSKTSGRRNMLVNSAFRNQDSVLIHSLARIEKNTGVDGVNCIHSEDTYSGTGEGNYIGAFWDSTQRNGVVTNIPIVKGKKYVLSCWIKSDNLDLPFAIECIFMDTLNQQNRGNAHAKSKIYHVDNVKEWKRITFVLDTTNSSPYADKIKTFVAVNFWSNNKNVPKADGATEYPTCNAYICKPMMEEGDTYGGWTLSDGDYDYVGGNMIDNARTLEVGGSLKSINESNVADYGLAYYGDSMSLRINNTNAGSTPSIMMFQPSLKVGVDYMFSFLAKGTANIGLYALCGNSVDGDYLLSEDSANADVRIVDTFRNRYASIILIPTQLTTEYKRYWGHMRFYGHVPTKLYLQLNHAGEVYISQPKLEIGATMTEFTERKTDLVDKASLKKAGIEITTDKVKLYGDKVEVVTTTKNEDGTSTDTQTAMFSNGKLNANLIDADKIEVKHLWAKSEDGTTKVGYFGNYEIDACKVDDTTYAPLFVGGDTASQSSFYVSSEGAMYATSGYIGGFNIGKTSIDGINGQNKVMLTPGYISFDNKTHGIDNIIGANWKYGLDYVGQQIVVKYDHATPSYDGNIGIANLKNIALYVSASGNIDRLSRDTGIVNSVYPCGNHAIFCDKGDFAGFRPCFRIITSSQTLSKYDVVVEIVETWKKHNSITGEDTSVEVGPVTISLPTNPEIGQMYWIIRSTRHNYSMKTTDGTQIYTPGGVTTFYTFKTQNEMVCVVYTGSNWRVMWNMGV